MHADYAQRKKLTTKIDALAAYLRCLDPPPSVAAARGTRNELVVSRGRKIFAQRGCNECHASSEFTSSDSYDVGLVDEVGHARYNPPSLRGLSQRDSLLHDGRGKSPEEVIIGDQHPLRHDFTQEQLQDLVAFLQSL
jgi:CxxC motif-containing protein (DUF1111 family)